MKYCYTSVFLLLLPLVGMSQVGIGTTSPDGILHLDNGATDTDFIIEKDDATSADIIFHSAGTAIGVIGMNSSENLMIENDNLDTDILITINEGGTSKTPLSFDASTSRVGFGTTTPDNNAHVYSSGRAITKIRGATTASALAAELLLHTAEDARSRGVRMQCADDSEWFVGNPYLGNGFTIGRHASQPEYVANSLFFMDENGDVGLGTTSPSYRLHVVDDAASGFAAYFFNDGNHNGRGGVDMKCGADNASTTGTQAYVRCYDGDGDELGGLESSTGTVQVFTTSDRRLKTNIEDTKLQGREIVNALRVVDYQWKRDPSGAYHDGFIAQEAALVYPTMVDTIRSSLGKEHMTVSFSELIPVLIKSAQEQEELIDQLKTEAKHQEDLIRQIENELKRIKNKRELSSSTALKE